MKNMEARVGLPSPRRDRRLGGGRALQPPYARAWRLSGSVLGPFEVDQYQNLLAARMLGLWP